MRTPPGDGLQATRTALSWRRTVASATACSALLVHHAVVDVHGWGTAMLLIAAAIGPLGLAAAAHARSRREHATPAMVVLTAAVVVLFVALPLASTVSPPT